MKGEQKLNLGNHLQKKRGSTPYRQYRSASQDCPARKLQRRYIKLCSLLLVVGAGRTWPEADVTKYLQAHYVDTRATRSMHGNCMKGSGSHAEYGGPLASISEVRRRRECAWQ